MVDWAMKSQAAEGQDPHEFYMDFVKRWFTLGKEQTPEDVANAMLFLVSEESRNITGYTIYVDGGHKRAGLQLWGTADAA